VLGSLAKGVAFLRAVDAAQADTCGLLVAQNFERVAVVDTDERASKLSSQKNWTVSPSATRLSWHALFSIWRLRR